MCVSRLAASLVAALFVASRIAAAEFPRVDADLAEYDAAIAKMDAEFAKVNGDAADKEWVKKKLKHMVDVDQYMRKFESHNEPQYTKEEREYYGQRFIERALKLDRRNTDDLKSLLMTIHWFTVSEWGKAADGHAWLLVQHADHDRPFQEEVLTKLEKLYPMGETQPKNYAYLYDRVATSWQDATKRRPQRYGTQGMCTGPGKWEPYPIEDPDNVDARRAEVGLPPLREYIDAFKDICK